MAEQEYLVKGSTLTGVANAIRSKAGITGTFPLSEFASKIESISAGHLYYPELLSLHLQRFKLLLTI